MNLEGLANIIKKINLIALISRNFNLKGNSQFFVDSNLP